MYEYDRLKSILEILKINRSATVEELAKKLYVSDTTIRRDLNKLESRGFVRRVFGGVVLLDNDRSDIPFYSATDNNYTQKSIVAKMAVDYIQDGDVLMLDASMTVSLLIPHLRRFTGLTIITNASMSMPGLQDLDAKIYCTGGLALRNSQGYVGCYAENNIRNFHAEKLFFTCRGLTTDGYMCEQSAEEVELHKVMFKHSYKHILLVDSTKFGKQYCYSLGTLDNVDVFLSDGHFPGWHEKQTGDSSSF